MGEKNGKIANTSRRRILAICLAVTLLPVITLALRPFSGLDSIGLARAQDDSAPALAAGSDTLAEWHVFLVATNNYYDPDDPNLPALRYAEADADSLEKIFKALGVKDENITVLKSSNQSYFTRSNKESIKEGYQRFLDVARKDDSLTVLLKNRSPLFFFAVMDLVKRRVPTIYQRIARSKIGTRRKFRSTT